MNLSPNDYGLMRWAGCSVAELARQFGTPLFVYDASIIQKRCDELRGFDAIRYAQKANSNLEILRLLRSWNICVDAVSPGEIARALHAGYDPNGNPPPIVYTADVFTRDALDVVSAKHVAVNCGSLDMIRQIGERQSHREIMIRVNPGFGHGHHRKTNTGGLHSKHGIWHEQLGDAISIAGDYEMSIRGLHVHLGSGADWNELLKASQAVERLGLSIGSALNCISAGGGLSVPYRSTDSRPDLARYTATWRETADRLSKQLGHSVHVEAEPGRYLVAECGILIAEIRAVQVVSGRRFYLLDAGFNLLPRPILYGAYHPIYACSASKSLMDDVSESVVGGPLCESGDIFTQSEGGFVETRLLPRMDVGDYLVIGVTGAYAMSMASHYNSYPLPAEVLVADGCPRIVRRRETIDDLLRCEVKADSC